MTDCSAQVSLLDSSRAPHIHTLTHTHHTHTDIHTHLHTHTITRQRTQFSAHSFFLQRTFLHFLSFIKTWLYVIEIENEASSTPIHFVLLTSFSPHWLCHLSVFSNFKWVDLIYFKQKESEFKLGYPPQVQEKYSELSWWHWCRNILTDFQEIYRTYQHNVTHR